MRCSKCGKRISKRSSFCVKCGTKVPPIPQKDNKTKSKIGSKGGKIKRREKRSNARILIPAATVLILALLTFLLFGGEWVPEKIKNMKGYSHLTGAVKDRLPNQSQLPFQLPELFRVDFSFTLPFKLPDPGNLLGDRELPDKEQIMEDLAAYEGEEESRLEFDSLEIEKRITREEENKETIYVITETKDDQGTRSNFYQLLYQQHLIGGWKLDEVTPYNVEGQSISVAGVDNKMVIQDKTVYSDLVSNWKYSNTKVQEHYTDVNAGLDIVLVYMELENEYVKMTGTKEVVYQYDEQTNQWTPLTVSKLTALSIEPVNQPL